MGEVKILLFAKLNILVNHKPTRQMLSTNIENVIW